MEWDYSKGGLMRYFIAVLLIAVLALVYFVNYSLCESSILKIIKRTLYCDGSVTDELVESTSHMLDTILMLPTEMFKYDVTGDSSLIYDINRAVKKSTHDTYVTNIKEVINSYFEKEN